MGTLLISLFYLFESIFIINVFFNYSYLKGTTVTRKKIYFSLDQTKLF